MRYEFSPLDKAMIGALQDCLLSGPSSSKSNPLNNVRRHSRSVSREMTFGRLSARPSSRAVSASGYRSLSVAAL